MKKEDVHWAYFETPLFHRQLFSDKDRIAKYKEAIKQNVKRDDTAVDLGCGLGIMAFLAEECKAKKIYAIEKTSIIEEAKQAAQKNNILNVEFINKLSTDVHTIKNADVLIAEIFGELGLDEGILTYIKDAQRFLKKGAKIIPRAIDVYFIPFESNALYDEYVRYWDEQYFGYDFSTMKQRFKQVSVDMSAPFRFLAKPQRVFHFDLQNIPEYPLLTSNVNFHRMEKGLLHGFMGYFEATLAEGVTIGNHPERRDSHWRNVVFFDMQPKIVDEQNDIRCTLKGIPEDAFRWECDWQIK